MPFAPEGSEAIQMRATFWAIFEKFFLGPPFKRFQKMRIFGDHAKIAITWQFGHSLSRFMRQNLAQCLHFKSILSRR